MTRGLGDLDEYRKLQRIIRTSSVGLFSLSLQKRKAPSLFCAFGQTFRYFAERAYRDFFFLSQKGTCTANVKLEKVQALAVGSGERERALLAARALFARQTRLYEQLQADALSEIVQRFFSLSLSLSLSRK